MTDLHASPLALTKTKLVAGVWEGLLTGSPQMPRLSVTHQNEPLHDVTISETDTEGTWHVSIPIPTACISDGLHTVLVTDAETGARLDHIVLMAGEALGDDLRAEVELLRAELDMLKRAFRRHCVETG